MTSLVSRRRRGDEEYDEMELRKMIIEIGDRTGLERQIDVLHSALVKAWDDTDPMTSDVFRDRYGANGRREFMLDYLFRCISSLSTKTSVYTTVVALVAKDCGKDFTKIVLGEAARQLQSSMLSCKWQEALLLIRFCTDLCNTDLLSCVDVISFLQTLAAQCTSSNPRQRADTFCLFVLYALPWCGRALNDSCPAELAQILQTLELYMRAREPSPSERVYHSGNGHKVDHLMVVWSQIQNFIQTGYTVGSILKPYNTIESVREAVRPTSSVDEGALSGFIVPDHKPTNIYFDKPAALHLFYAWDESESCQDTKPLVGPEHGGDEKLAVELSYFTDRLKIKAVDRLVATLYIADTLYHWNASREDCVKKLLLFPVKHNYEHLIVEGVLSHLLMLPQTTFNTVYYCSVLGDLCKADLKLPVVVAEAMETMYERVAVMDTELVDRFVQLFALQLANFGYRWLWEDWTPVLDQEDIRDGTAKKLFIFEVCSQLLRHSYRDRILDAIPPNFHVFVPDQPRHNFKWEAKRVTKAGQEKQQPPKFKQAAESIFSKIASGTFTGDDLTLELDQQDHDNDMSDSDKIEILIHCILINGIETVSHQRKILDKYKDALQAIVSSQPDKDMDLRLEIIKAATAFWDNSPQHKLITVSQLLELRIIEPVDVVHWLFVPTVVAYWERGYPWEALRATVDALLTEIMETYKNGNKLKKAIEVLETEKEKLGEGEEDEERRREIDREYAEKRKQNRRLQRVIEDCIEHLKLMFFELMGEFRRILEAHYAKYDDLAAKKKDRERLDPANRREFNRQRAKDYVWHKSAISHFNEMGCKYLMFTYAWRKELDETVFKDVDKRIKEIYEAWFTTMCFRRWCPNKGFEATNDISNVCLELFIEMANAAREQEKKVKEPVVEPKKGGEEEGADVKMQDANAEK